VDKITLRILYSFHVSPEPPGVGIGYLPKSLPEVVGFGQLFGG